MEAWNKLINIALVVIVILVTIFFAKPAYSALFRVFGASLDDLPSSDKLKIEGNFNELVGNIDSCMKINDSNCYCDGIPGFPDNTFPKKTKIVIMPANATTQFILRYNEKDARKANLTVNFSAFYYQYPFGTEGGWVEDEGVKELLEEKKAVINFDLIRMTSLARPLKKEELYHPYFEKKGGITDLIASSNIPLASNLLYKSSNKIGFVTIAGTGKRSLNTELVEAQLTALGQLSPCAPNKNKAKEEFSKLVNVLKGKQEGGYYVDLPSNYKISLGGKTLLLKYNANTIQNQSLDNCICNDCTFSKIVEGKQTLDIFLQEGIPCVGD